MNTFKTARLVAMVVLFASLTQVALAASAPARSPASQAIAPKCDFYADPLGLAQGSGTQSSPFDLKTALTSRNTISAGKTLCLNGGIYHGVFTSTLAGTEHQRVTITATPNEWPVLLGSSGATATLSVHGPFVTVQNLEITLRACLESF